MEQLLQFFTPEVYQLNLEISRESKLISGEVRVFGTPHAEVVKFHAVDLEIKNISARKVVDKSDFLNNKNFSDFSPCDFTQKSGILQIKNIFSSKNCLVEYKITFETKLNKNLQGCYLSNYIFDGKTEKIVTTQFESHYARECFPCIDEPAAKAEFYLTIKAPDLADGDVVLANTELLETRDGNEFIFAPTPRMSTYLLAWVIGKFQKVETVNKHGVKVATYAALNQNPRALDFANDIAARALDYYDEKFGIPYPLAKLDQVALPDFEAGAMENWGLVTYRESCMLAEPDASIDTKQSVAVTVTHELSHQWFGDLVTMAWWNDLWLNESFATIMEYYATDALCPEFKVWQEFFTGDCVAALRRDCLPGVQAVQQEVSDPAEIATLFDSAIVYAKGARLVLMLIRLMGEEKFDAGVRDYFQKYQYNNTVADDLWTSLQPYADFDVKSFMHAWISQPGYPALQHSSSSDSWIQQRFLINGTTDDTKWPLPEVKDDMSGHYLLDLSDATYHQKLDDFASLGLEQKLRLLIDRMLLAKAGNTSSADLADLLPKFIDEDAPVWDILLSIINDLKILFPYGDPAEDDYRAFLRHIIYSRVRAIDISSSNGDSNTKRLRTILAVVARYARDMEIIDRLAALYDSDLSQIDAELRGNILMSKMIVDEADTFPYLLEKYQSESDPELLDDILGALASAKLDENITTALHLLEQPEIVRPQDHLFLYIYLLRNEKARPLALDWLYAHWSLVVSLSGEKSVEDYPRCTAGYITTREEADRFYNFFDQHSDNPVLKRTLAMAKVSIESRLHLTERETSAVQARIKQLLEEMK